MLRTLKQSSSIAIRVDYYLKHTVHVLPTQLYQNYSKPINVHYTIQNKKSKQQKKIHRGISMLPEV